MFPGELVVDDGAGAITLPGQHLIRGDLEVGEDLQDFIGVGAELGEHILRLLVLVDASKPVVGGNGHYAANGPDLLPVEQRHGLGERDAVTSDQALGGLGAERVNVEGAPDGHHQSQQQEREGDAQYGQDAAPLVAKRAFSHEAS